MTKLVAVSGGFDPLHVGHLRMFKEAAQHGDLCVIVNNDNWLRTKKGYVFMPEQERVEIICALSMVHHVTLTLHTPDDPDPSVVRDLKLALGIANTLGQELMFCNGGDRVAYNTPEMQFCKAHNIELVWRVGGGKVQSSSTLITKAGGALLQDGKLRDYE